MLLTQGKTDCKPAEVGYDESRLDVLHKHFQRLIDDGELQCATYCLSRKGKVFAHGGVGKKSFREDDNTPVQPDSPRWIASITKSFTAVAVMKLVEDGLTRLDVPVGQILPQFDTPPFNGINLFHLLTHTSGLHADDGCFDNKYQTDYWKMIHAAYKLHDFEKNGEFDWLAAALGTIGSGLRAPIGSEWAYCSFGFTILGAVIEKLTGIHAHKFIEDEICKPLGMNDTVFWENLTPDMAKHYIITDEDGEKDMENIINGVIEDDDKNSPSNKYNIPRTGGGLNGTAYDLVRFGNAMIYGGSFGGARILGRKAAEKMTTLSLKNVWNRCWNSADPDRKYGIGFDMRHDLVFSFSQGTFFHEGAGACAFFADPKEEFVGAWIVPYARYDDWFPRPIYNTQLVAWSGLI